jgi:hypothetical protein
MRRRLAVLLLLGTAFLPAGEAAAQFPPDSFTNLRVLPKDIHRDSLIAMMAGFTRALGVRCSYCHQGEVNQPLSTYDFASDAKQSKRNARIMIQMLRHINGEHLAQLETRVTPATRVECATCHRGVTPPRSLQEILVASWQVGGADSALATYRALRQRYYGSAAYDFGEVPLTDVATAITQLGGKIDDAERLLALNVEMNPTSNFAKATACPGRDRQGSGGRCRFRRGRLCGTQDALRRDGGGTDPQHGGLRNAAAGSGQRRGGHLPADGSRVPSEFQCL